MTMTRTEAIARAMAEVLEENGLTVFKPEQSRDQERDTISVLFSAYMKARNAMLSYRPDKIEVEEGQVWEDNDARQRVGRKPRRGVIRKVVKHMRKNVMGEPKDFAIVEWNTGRTTEVSLKRFRQNSTGYRLIEQINVQQFMQSLKGSP